MILCTIDRDGIARRYVKAYDGEVRQTHEAYVRDYNVVSVNLDSFYGWMRNPSTDTLLKQPKVIRRVQTASNAGGTA